MTNKERVLVFLSGSHEPVEVEVPAKARKSPKPARELAARALCRCDGHPEDIMFEGRPMWQSYLPEADAVLDAIGHKS